ncbi:MAG: alpha/beta fold hydrolase [Anaerolineales bacterium]|nr:alpha/beta fold hydrolase [Anaerolineales bacterium]
MTTFILIHGMWHGGWCWEKLSALLKAAGHDVHAPTLAGLAERADMLNDDIDLNTHVQEIVNLCESKNLRDVILVGHSSGGFMAHVVTDKIPERVAHIVNLDGIVPENGKSLADLIGETWDFFKKKATESGNAWRCPPIMEWTFGINGAELERVQSKLTPHPLKTLTTPVTLENPKTKSIPSTFIRCSEGMTDEDIAAEEKKLTGLGMNFRSLPTGHDAMITMPKELAEVLLEIAKENK